MEDPRGKASLLLSDGWKAAKNPSKRVAELRSKHDFLSMPLAAWRSKKRVISLLNDNNPGQSPFGNILGFCAAPYGVNIPAGKGDHFVLDLPLERLLQGQKCYFKPSKRPKKTAPSLNSHVLARPDPEADG